MATHAEDTTIEPNAALVRYDAMCRAIDDCYSVDEVKDIRDKAFAFEAYARQAKNTEAERRACEIRLRAERKAGQLLAEMEKNRGAAQPTRSSNTTTLADLGVSKNQSSKWQQLAAIPEDEFEAALSGPEKPTTTGIVSKPKQEPMDNDALWVWGRLRDFEKRGILDRPPNDVLSHMTDAMRADALRLSGAVADWLEGLPDE